jgi:ubiquinone/menaquinone biosynthesis C-methylase UbiE
VITGTSAVRDAYRDEQVARSYIEERFRQPLGALLHHRQLEVLKRVIRSLRPGRVLEIAPGPGRLTVGVAPLLRRGLTIVDASEPMLKEALVRLRRSDGAAPALVQADAFNLPFSTSFDLVYTFRLIRHFALSDRARLYSEIARLLRPGGLLVFDAVNETASAPLRAKAPPDEYRHYDALTKPEDLRAELQQAGFDGPTLIGVQHRYPILARLQVLVAPRSRLVARGAMEAVDRWTGGEPLEWIVTCRRA